MLYTKNKAHKLLFNWIAKLVKQRNRKGKIIIKSRGRPFLPSPFLKPMLNCLIFCFQHNPLIPQAFHLGNNHRSHDLVEILSAPGSILSESGWNTSWRRWRRLWRLRTLQSHLCFLCSEGGAFSRPPAVISGGREARY